MIIDRSCKMETHLHTLWLLLLFTSVSGGILQLGLLKSDLRPREGDVRLAGLTSTSAGRVEVYHSGQWGTVCDDNWDMTEAEVVCRQLGFAGATSVILGGSYTQAPGPIWLDDISCSGTETHLVTCDFKSWGQTDCSHKEDVGVICKPESPNASQDNATHSFDHSITLSDDLGRIFDTGIGCDFLIVAQSATGNVLENGKPETAETQICAHKVILSQYPLFNVSQGVTNITVDVSSKCQPLLSPFIRYIYTHKMDITFPSAICLHWMASTFGVKQLKEDVGRLFPVTLPEDPSFQSQVSLYNYAVETEDLILQESCLKFLAWNYQNLTASPAWASLPVGLLTALLASSDLVVTDEYVVLQAVEGWIAEMGSSISSASQAELLSHVRFPMIPVENLYQLELNSPLYSSHKTLYQEKVMKAFEFNVLLFSKLVTKPTFNKIDADYQPRIYTAAPWSTVFKATIKTPAPRRVDRYNHGYNDRFYFPQATVAPYTQSMSLSTPVHSSLIFKDKQTTWSANVFKTKSECSRQGLSCDALPVAWLAPQNQQSQHSNILYRNRVVMTCNGKFVCQVHSFKGNQASVDGSTFSCPGGQYTYQFVLRPEYV